LQARFQVPGAQIFETGITYEKGPTGKAPHWRCVRDDLGRIMVAICHNVDLGDVWEWSDDAKYEEKWASLAYRIAMDYFTYDLTHWEIVEIGVGGQSDRTPAPVARALPRRAAGRPRCSTRPIGERRGGGPARPAAASVIGLGLLSDLHSRID
jgi:hypothetical protein